MMRVVFFDKLRETHLSVENVSQINSDYSQIKGRVTKVWRLTLADGKTRAFKQKDYEIYRVEV